MEWEALHCWRAAGMQEVRRPTARFEVCECQMTVYMVVRMGYMSDMMTREGGAWDEGGATRWEMEVVADGVRLREKDARWVQQLYDGTHVPVRVWAADHARSTEHVVIWRGHVVGQEAEPGGGRSREDER